MISAMAEPKKGDEFKPGDMCSRSGIYRVVHDVEHKIEHEVTVIHGKPFPPCRHCGQHPRFILERAAQHILSNEWFSEPPPSNRYRTVSVRGQRPPK